METEEKQAEAGRLVGTLDSLLSRGRLGLMMGAFVVEVGLFLTGLLAPASQLTRESVANQTGSQISSITQAPPAQAVFLIFGHNVLIALVETVPLLGALLFASSIYTTGLVAQAILASQGLPGGYGVLLFLLPYSLVELSAYAVAVGSGIMLLVAWRRKSLSAEARVFVLEVCLVAGLLMVAAAMEEVTLLYPALGFALWVPTGVAIAAVVLARSGGTR
jgi:stage II sporulation SpoM-like protein